MTTLAILQELLALEAIAGSTTGTQGTLGTNSTGGKPKPRPGQRRATFTSKQGAKNGRPGTILRTSGNRYTVKFDDGRQETVDANRFTVSDITEE